MCLSRYSHAVEIHNAHVPVGASRWLHYNHAWLRKLRQGKRFPRDFKLQTRMPHRRIAGIDYAQGVTTHAFNCVLFRLACHFATLAKYHNLKFMLEPRDVYLPQASRNFLKIICISYSRKDIVPTWIRRFGNLEHFNHRPYPRSVIMTFKISLKFRNLRRSRP